MDVITTIATCMGLIIIVGNVTMFAGALLGTIWHFIVTRPTLLHYGITLPKRNVFQIFGRFYVVLIKGDKREDAIR